MSDIKKKHDSLLEDSITSLQGIEKGIPYDECLRKTPIMHLKYILNVVLGAFDGGDDVVEMLTANLSEFMKDKRGIQKPTQKH